MSSARQTAANRANATRSTGPRSATGKKRSARNAAKHRLSLPVALDPHLAPDVAALAREIAGDKDQLLEAATTIAEAQVDLNRVRRMRSKLIHKAIQARTPLTKGGPVPRHEELTEGQLEPEQENRPEHHACVLADLASQLAKLDRYERRALSRRKFAIRRFDSEPSNGLR